MASIELLWTGCISIGFLLVGVFEAPWRAVHNADRVFRAVEALHLRGSRRRLRVGQLVTLAGGTMFHVPNPPRHAPQARFSVPCRGFSSRARSVPGRPRSAQ